MPKTPSSRPAQPADHEEHNDGAMPRSNKQVNRVENSRGGKKSASKKRRNFLKDSLYSLTEEELRQAGMQEEQPSEPEDGIYVELPMDKELFEEEQLDYENDEIDEEAYDAPQSGPVVAENALGKGKKKRHRKWYGVPLGTIILCLALVGTIFLGTKVYTYIYNRVTDDTEERTYDSYLTPVVILDPQPFETLEAADKQMLLESSIWRVVFSHMEDADLEYDEYARVVFSADLVNQNAVELFGAKCILTPADINVQGSGSGAEEGSPETTIQYNAEENAYHVPLVPTVGSYIPYTESVKKSGDKKYLRVAYRTRITNSGAAGITSSGTQAEYVTAKYMEYELTYDEELDQEYISAIRAIEE